MILVDATPLQSEHRLRGVGAYLRALLPALERLGAEPHYLVSTYGLEHVEGVLPAERCHPLWRPHRPAQVYWLYNELALRGALLRLRPRAFFAPDFNGLVTNPAGRTVAVLHDLTVLKLGAPRGGGPSARLDALRWRAYFAKLKRQRHLIAISDSVRRDAERLLAIPPDRLTVVPHGVDLTRFRESRGRGAYAGTERYFVHLGGRNANKNQATLLAAFARVAHEHDDARLRFAGPWSDADHAWLAERSRALGVEAKVAHLGYVPDDDLPSLFGNAVAFVFPSLEEGFGLPVLEAMASGGAVITSDRSSLVEVAGDAALTVDPTDPGALADAMTRLLDAPDERERLRAAGQAHVQRFTWDATARRTLALLEPEATPA